MTAVAEPLYVRDGSRFVLYSPGAQHTPPIPTPRAVSAEVRAEEAEDTGWNPDAVPTRERPVVRVGPAAYRCWAPRCPHDRFRGCKVRGCPGPR